MRFPAGAAACALGLLALVGCAQLGRAPRVAEAGRAQVAGIANARFLAEGDPAPMIAEFRRAYAREAAYFQSIHRPLADTSYLAISGGGDNGAFGAGVLVGWSERGTRPTFKGVTGVSAGALVAPFAFAGPEYDSALAEIFTTIDQKDVFESRPIFAAIGSDAMADTTPLSNMIARYMDERLAGDIARVRPRPTPFHRHDQPGCGPIGDLEYWRYRPKRPPGGPWPDPPNSIGISLDTSVLPARHVRCQLQRDDLSGITC